MFDIRWGVSSSADVLFLTNAKGGPDDVYVVGVDGTLTITEAESSSRVILRRMATTASMTIPCLCLVETRPPLRPWAKIALSAMERSP